MTEQVNVPKKRGRKPKVNVENQESSQTELKVPKKRGRKPKGGKIINIVDSQQGIRVPIPNIILHLKCSLSDLETNKLISSISYNPEVENVESFQFFQNKTHDLNMLTINDDTNEPSRQTNTNTNTNDIPETSYVNDDTKIIWKKLRSLAVKLHTNNISEKRSACFWCTCDFDNPPIYIPKLELNGSYQCYGCFCSPECATAYLFNQDVDSAILFERYHMLNHIYCKIYDYERNIKPAPNPHYTLDKFYGNLTIQEYRRLLKNERLLLVVDKPLVRILPELHEDNDDLNFNTRMIPSASKFKVKRKIALSKNEIMTENFNFK
jgi:hypothetical protein|tara:strand:- start:55 stop:1020 length:966 start_codon:yes stop_codon:yes gene_type:complete